MNKYIAIPLLIAIGVAGLAIYLYADYTRVTPDMALVQVSRHVKSIQMRSYICDSRGKILNDTLTWNNHYFEFDQDGHITKGFVDNPQGDPTTIRIHRNEKHQIEIVQTYLLLWDAWYDINLTYDDDNRLVSSEVHSPDGLSNITYTYDEDGNLASEKEITINGDPYIGITRYRILQTDEHGNWVKVLARIDYDISGEKTSEYRLDKREITYY